MASVREKLGIVRFMMVLSNFTPLFALLAVRGICIKGVSFDIDTLLIPICFGLIVLPNVVLILRIVIAKINVGTKTIVTKNVRNQKENILVYLFAMLIPLYQTQISSERELISLIVAFVFLFFLFWHLNLYYMNIFFALAGYYVYLIEPSDQDSIKKPLIILSKSNFLKNNQSIKGLRLSNSIYMEMENE